MIITESYCMTSKWLERMSIIMFECKEYSIKLVYPYFFTFHLTIIYIEAF